MISVEDARQRILASLKTLPHEDVAISDALGRVLAQDIQARRTQPPTDISAMDGYAARSSDLSDIPKTLKMIGESPAGGFFGGTVGQNETVRIFTGGPLPQGADTVVIQENTIANDALISVKTSAKAGEYVRKAGLDFNEGEIGLRAGRILSARDIALAAAMNFPWLPVYRKPRIAILATGDEIVRPGDPIGPNQIVSSNAIALQAFIEVCGGFAVDLGISPDRTEALLQMANGARGTDLLITTGGVSVGDHDLVHKALRGAGLKVNFSKVAMRPGKPVMFGDLNGIPVLCLPGNPVSALVCALVFLYPALRYLLGIPSDERMVTEQVRLATSLAQNDHRQDYLRATLKRNSDGVLWADPYERQDSSMISLLSKAECLIFRPPNAPAAQVGDVVEVVNFPSGLAAI